MNVAPKTVHGKRYSRFEVIQLSTLLTILAICAGISILVKLWIKLAWAHYSNQYPSNYSFTGKEAACTILANNFVGTCCSILQGNNNCFYNEEENIVLSEEVYYGNSILAIGVAAHEAGHAIQFSQKNTPLKRLHFFSKSTGFMVIVSAIAVVAYIILKTETWLYVAAICTAAALATRLALLPIEFGASNLALLELSKLRIYTDNELRKIKRMLRACAYTYIAGVLDVLLLVFLLVLTILGSGKKNAQSKN